VLYHFVFSHTPEQLRPLLPRPKVFTAAVTAAVVAIGLAVLQELGVEVDAAVPVLDIVSEQDLTWRQVLNVLAPLVAAYLVREPRVELLEGEPEEGGAEADELHGAGVAPEDPDGATEP
jgi:hypothetical protein